jgi:hypothetical protein
MCFMTSDSNDTSDSLRDTRFFGDDKVLNVARALDMSTSRLDYVEKIKGN